MPGPGTTLVPYRVPWRWCLDDPWEVQRLRRIWKFLGCPGWAALLITDRQASQRCSITLHRRLLELGP